MSEVVVKKPWKSKTLLANLLVAILAMTPLADQFGAEQVMLVLSAVNIILRLVTKDKIGLND